VQDIPLFVNALFGAWSRLRSWRPKPSVRGQPPHRARRDIGWEMMMRQPLSSVPRCIRTRAPPSPPCPSTPSVEFTVETNGKGRVRPRVWLRNVFHQGGNQRRARQLV